MTRGQHKEFEAALQRLENLHILGDEDNGEPKGDLVNFALMASTSTSSVSKVINVDVCEPSCFEQACSNKVWLKAMNEEISSIVKNDTWTLCKLPQNRKCIGCKWIYKIKKNSDGSVERYKGRLVARGFTQKYGIDYEETFSPVARQETIWMVLSLAANKHWKVHHMDVKSAFLNGYLEEEVYVAQPQGFEIQGKEDQVYKLNKALYGLKQVPRAWYTRINDYFLKSGFQRSKIEHTLYYKK